MTAKERHEREEKLFAQIREIGESIRDITPENGHLCMTWFPSGHMDVLLFSGEQVNGENGVKRPVMVLDAWGETESGKLKVYRV